MGSQPASGNLVTRTVVDFAYESVAGASIAAAAPAPGALALLGVAGLAGTRRRR
jgi:MYXO-CTERM domain-containing protein